MTTSITQADIRRLIYERSVQVRADLAKKICTGFNQKDFRGREREIAVDILRLLLKDTAARVRKVLAEELKHNREIPTDIAHTLAADDTDIAEQILEHSPLLEEEELIAFVRAYHNVQKVEAIARRDNISASLSDALCRTREPAVIKTLLANQGASVREDTLDFLIREFGRDQSILEALVHRGGLPYTYAEKLFAIVSDQLKKDLSRRYRLARHIPDDITRNAREVSILSFLSPWMGQQDIQDLIVHMDRNKRLTDSVIIRALCAGNLRFFEAAMARRAGISVTNCRMLLLDPGSHSFEALYENTGMPESFRDAVRILFRLAQQETRFGQFHQANFPQRLVDRIVLEGHDKTIENMPYLLSIIGRSMSDVPSIH